MDDVTKPAQPGSSKPTKPKSGWLNVVVDYGPVLVFFLSYRHFSPADHNDPVGEMLAVVKSTAAFMLAAITALVVSRW